jgi:tetratricopeptide (TPR) repeat protein
MRRLTVLLLCLAARPLPAQDSPAGDSAAVARAIRAGDSLYLALKPEAALARYRAALALDSTNDDALWKAAREVVDIAKQLIGDYLKHRRDSLYLEAQTLAEAAVRHNPDNAHAHSMVAQALGRLSRTRGGKERVRFAKIIYDEAMRAVTLDSTEDAAYHVLGAWNAEIKRLSGLQRFFAKALFGAGFMDKANWDDAERYLARAVALRPDNIFHRLELAQIQADVGKYSAARAQLAVIDTLPIGDVLDHEYKQEAVALLEKIRYKRDKS